MTRSVLMAIALLMAAPAGAQEFFTEGFIYHNLARQSCKVDPEVFNASIDPIFVTTAWRGIEEVDAPDGEHRFEHPDGVTLIWMPAATDGPTCRIEIAAGAMDDAMLADFWSSTAEDIADYAIPEGQATEVGTEWRYRARPGANDRVFEYTVTRANDGAMVILSTPVAK